MIRIWNPTGLWKRPQECWRLQRLMRIFLLSAIPVMAPSDRSLSHPSHTATSHLACNLSVDSTENTDIAAPEFPRRRHSKLSLGRKRSRPLTPTTIDKNESKNQDNHDAEVKKSCQISDSECSAPKRTKLNDYESSTFIMNGHNHHKILDSG